MADVTSGAGIYCAGTTPDILKEFLLSYVSLLILFDSSKY